MSSSPFPDFPLLPPDAPDDSILQSSTPHGDDLAGPSSSSSMLSPLNVTYTPAESVLSVHYQSSDFSELDGDQADNYFDTDFSTLGGNTPSFLADDFDHFATGPSTTAAATTPVSHATPDIVYGATTYPMSPDRTPSLRTSPSQNHSAAAHGLVPSHFALHGNFSGLISPHQLSKQAPDGLPAFNGFALTDAATQLTPDTASTRDSSANTSHASLPRADGLGLGLTTSMSGPNPHVTVSDWGRDDSRPAADAPIYRDVRIKHEAQPSLDLNAEGDVVLSSMPEAMSHSVHGARYPDAQTGTGGIAPAARSATQLPASINEAASAREAAEQNDEVSRWLASAEDPNEPPSGPDSRFEGVSDREIDPTDETHNIEQPGSTYIRENGTGGPLNDTDYKIILNSHIWENAPKVRAIQTGKPTQPLTSQDAIAQFERMCHDTASCLSRSATWGTRRRSLPSEADIVDFTSGNVFKKLSLSRESGRRPSIFDNLRGLMRKPSTSQQHKRSRSTLAGEVLPNAERASDEYAPDDTRRDSKASNLAPPTRTQSWGKSKQHTPSINTAIINMGSSVASIGATHARSGSVSHPHAGSVSLSPPLAPPKSPRLKVSSSLRRPRSRSDLSTGTSSFSRLLKRAGGAVPATANASNPSNTLLASTALPYVTTPSHLPTPIRIPETRVAVVDPDDEDDDDDEGLEDGDLRSESDDLIDSITPDLAGFRKMVLTLNPALANTNKYLVDRIAYQQVNRYKSLLQNKVKHQSQVRDGTCPSGLGLCLAQGGSAPHEGRELPRGGRHENDYAADKTTDDLISPLDGAISPESFPKYIPMPPTTTLPAEFECQLCFHPKKFQKPSDWTKHVHEDVQPFTCTWDQCQHLKIFKRKADWVRHENEGHRHLEWWMCDVDECRHKCYRRDNFLQHLVREHKFTEPRHKTKAAIKKSGAQDPIWKHLDKCHVDTGDKPQDEPCRFCGKSFPTWKKLTVHLAKHMEHMSLPILRLVERAEVDADTLVSPVQDPPPRTFPPPTYPMDDSQQSLMNGYALSSDLMQQSVSFQGPVPQTVAYTSAGGQGVSAGANAGSFMYQGSTPGAEVQFQTPFYGQPTQYVTTPGLGLQMPSLDVTAAMSVQPLSGDFARSPSYGNIQATTGAYLGPVPAQYIGASQGMVIPVSTMNNALGLRPSISGGRLSYDGGVQVSIVGDEQFVHQGSASPYSHSPHQPQGHFFG